MVRKKQYIPILKWKGAEKGAIRDLRREQKSFISPLFEIVSPIKLSMEAKEKGLASIGEEMIKLKAKKIPEEIFRCFGDGRNFFVDFSLILPENIHDDFAEKFFSNAKALHLNFIPVISIRDDKEYVKKAIKNAEFGLCFRLNIADVKNTEVSMEVIKKIAGINNIEITVIVDLKDNITSEIFEEGLKFFRKLGSTVPNVRSIIASGAFPKDMSEFKLTEVDNHKDRLDWMNWRQYRSTEYIDYPEYSDYTIRHPIYDESALRHRATATIKYTLDTRWNIYKGRIGKYEDCLAYANLIMKDPKCFRGENFSAGDAYIKSKGEFLEEYLASDKKRGTGNAEQWIRAGINHHIAVVIDQLSNLGDYL